MTEDELIREIEAEKDLMIAVATGGPRINDVNEEYKAHLTRVQAALEERGLRDPNPHSDLWSWYGKWSSGDLPSHQSRRTYISDLFDQLTGRIRGGPHLRGAEIFDEPTGWARVDRGLGEVRERLEEAETEEQYQAVGLLCREVLVSLAQTVYDPIQHLLAREPAPSTTDAKRMLELYLLDELAGSSNEVARRHARASLDMANELQHRRTAHFREAALCAEATASVVNLIAIMSGQRNP